MFANWVVAISLIAKSNFGAVASQASAQSAAAQKSMNGLKSSMSGVAQMGKVLDRSLIGIGIGSAAVLAMGIKGAAQLQSATVQAAIAMGKTGSTVAQTTANMREFRDIALEMSKITGQSLPEAMGVISTMASGGISAQQIRTNWKPIAQFTDVLHFGKDHMDYGEAAKLGTGLLHEMRLFTTDQARFGMGEIARMGYLSPHGTQQLATQVRAAAPTLENLLPGSVQSRAKQIVDLVAWGDRMGGLSRFGTGISQLVTNMVAPRSKRVVHAMEDLGVYDGSGKNRFLDARTGEFDLMGALRQVSSHYRDAVNLPGGRGQAVRSMMGLNANAARYLQLLTSKESLAAFESVQKQQAAMGNDPAAWLDKTQVLLMGELSTQTGLLISNFKTLATLIGDSFVGPLTKLVHVLADVTGNAATFLAGHPKTAAVIGGTMAATAGYAAFRAVQMGFSAIHGFAVFSKHPHLGIGVGHLLGGGAEKAAVGVGAAGGIGDVLGALFGFGQIRRVLGAVGDRSGLSGVFAGARAGLGGAARGIGAGVVGSDGFKAFAAAAKPFMGALKFLPELFAKLGLRMVPLVGEVLLVIDSLNFLRTHMKNIGYFVGQFAVWLAANLPNAIRAAGGLAVSAMTELMGEVIGVLNPGNWAKMVLDFKNGVNDAVRDSNALHLTAQQRAGMKFTAPLAAIPQGQGVGPTVHNWHVNVQANSRSEGVAAGNGLLSVLNQSGVVKSTPLGSTGSVAQPRAH